MPFSGGGVFTLTPGYTAVVGQDIVPSQHNPPLEELANGLSQTFVRDGRAAATGNFNMGTFRITNVSDGVSPQDVATKRQVDLRAWKTIRDQDISVTTYQVNDLSDYSSIRISGFLYPSTQAIVIMQLSSDNGLTFDTGNNYAYMLTNATPGVAIGYSSTSSSIPLSADSLVGASALNGIYFNVDLRNFNKVTRTVGYLTSFLENSFTLGTAAGGVRNNQIAAHNSFRIFSVGVMNGHLLVEGIEG